MTSLVLSKSLTSPPKGAGSAIGDSLVAVTKTILPIQKFKILNICYVEPKTIKNVYPEFPSIKLALFHFKLWSQATMSSTTPWNFHLRRVTIVAPRTAQRASRRNIRDPRLPSYRKPSPMKFTGKPIEIQRNTHPSWMPREIRT